MIYFTSDLHFYHDKDFIWQARGFKSIDEMNAEIVRRWNKIITADDYVYILGDLTLDKAYLAVASNGSILYNAFDDINPTNEIKSIFFLNIFAIT